MVPISILIVQEDSSDHIHELFEFDHGDELKQILFQELLPPITVATGVCM